MNNDNNQIIPNTTSSNQMSNSQINLNSNMATSVAPAAPVAEQTTPVAPAAPVVEQTTPVAPAAPVVEQTTPVAPVTPIEEVPTNINPIPNLVINEPVVQPPIPPANGSNEGTSNIQESNNIKQEKPKRGNKVVLFILIFIVLVIAVLGGLYVYSHSAKVIISNSVTHLQSFKKYFEVPIELKNTNSSSLTGNMKINIDNIEDTPEGTYAEYNQYINLINKFDLDYTFNVNEDKSLIRLGLNENSENIFGVKFYSTTNSNYIFLEQLYDKYIEIEDLRVSLTGKNKSIEDYKYLSDFAINSIIKNADKHKFKKDVKTIEINGKNKKVDSLAVTYNDKELCELLDLVITDIKNDEKAHEIVKSSYEEFDDYKMSDSIKNIDEQAINEYTYTVYTDRILGTVQGIDLLVNAKEKEFFYYDDCYNESMFDDDFDYFADDIEDPDQATGMSIEDDLISDDFIFDNSSKCNYDDEDIYNEVKYLLEYRYNENPTISLSKDDDLVGTLEFEKSSDSLMIGIKNSKTKIGDIKIVSNKSIHEINGKIKIGDIDIVLKNSINIKEIKNKEEYNLEGILTFNIIKNNTTKFKAMINSTSTIKTTSTIDENVASSIKFSDMSTDEIIKLYVDLLDMLANRMSLQ